MIKKSAGFLLLTFLTIFISSCNMETIVMKPGYDFNKIKRIAVLQFRDSAYYPNSGAMVSELFVKYMLKAGYNVVERDEIDAILREHNLAISGALNPEQVKEYGKICGVDAFVTGTIPMVVPDRAFYEGDNPRYIAAQVGVTCRMISVETGEILWAGSDTYDAMNTQTAFEYLVSSLARQLIKDIARAK
jgi:curli biogenesis system outer membrane secretion channel CsgG